MLSESEIRAITRKSAEEAIDAFAEKLGIEDDNLPAWHADRLWLRNRREVEQAVVRQGIGAVFLALLAAAGTAVIFWLKSGAPGR